jgi:crotonobetainyl-CoA:carnitine CoA-transferase CaiB-like acyl-CoA transferase
VTAASRAAAFQDVRVLDLSVAPPGALAAMHLGEYGAAVTRVASRESDTALWRYANRTKRVVPARDGLVAELAAEADVVVVDLPADELRAAGLTASQLRAANPALVHAWMPPHAPTGETAALPYDELLLWAWTGLAAQQPGATSDHPVASVVPIITYEQGALGACAIGAALVDRARRGVAHACTVSGLHAVNAMNTSIRIDFPGIFRPFGANKDGTGASPQFRMYRCADGVWLFVCALTPSFFFKLLEALDVMDIMLIPEVDGEFAKFVTPPVQKIANERFAARMAEMDSAAWSARFDEAGVPYAPVQTRADWSASETVAANDLLLPVPGSEGTVGPGLPAVLSRTPGSLAVSAAGAHVPSVANELPTALPLDGTLVVDATKFLAGPFGCLVLQDLGARVVKVDPPGGEDFRSVAAASFSALNRDKDQVSLDLKDASDRDAFTALVQQADALVENMSRQVAEELHLDLDGLRAAHPQLVHCHIDGWGEGPLAGTAGFDPLLQARSGIMVAQGGVDHPVIQPMSLHDIGTGTLAAFGTIAALYARTHLGEGQAVDAALSRTSVAYQGGEFTTAPDLPAPVLGFVDYVGDEPDHCFVEATDGWLAVAALTDAQRAAWAGIRAEVGDRSVDEVVAACRAAGVPAIAVLGRDEVFTSEALAALGVWLTVDDDDLGEVKVMRDYSRWDGVSPRTRAHLRAAGRDNDAVLGELTQLRRNESATEASRPR